MRLPNDIEWAFAVQKRASEGNSTTLECAFAQAAIDAFCKAHNVQTFEELCALGAAEEVKDGEAA